MNNHKRRRFGDRDDGTRVRDLDAFHKFIPYALPNRADTEVFMDEPVDVTNLLKFLKEKNESQSEIKYTIFHAVSYAIAKTLTLRPALNRFIAGRRFYERDHVSLSFVAKRAFADDAEENLIVIHTNPEMNLSDIARAISGDVKKSRDMGTNAAGNTLELLVRLPRPLIKLFMKLIILLDYYGIMPRSLREMDPNFTSVLMSNLGSIGLGAPYHHLNNYGTNSIMLTIGKIYEKKVQGENGEELRSFIDFGITLDERIGDGFYYSRSINLLKAIMLSPSDMEKPLSAPVDFKY